uniref:CUB domain-containing protein n=1 Tax=Macrostomum lignano TaxID=282301 RepID=A0A1I8JAP3_9PLAT
MNCTWQIVAPVGERIAVWFTYINLHYSRDSPDSRDYVDMFEGMSTSHRTSYIRSFTGPQWSPTKMPPTVVSTSNALTVRFISDGSATDKGFRLRYEAKVIPHNGSCGSIRFLDASNTSGVIPSHQGRAGGMFYSSNMTCEWQLPQIPDLKTDVTLLNISLAKGDCMWLTAAAASGPGRRTYQVFIGWNTRSINHTHEPAVDVWMHFKSDSYSESTGFLIHFRLYNGE